MTFTYHILGYSQNLAKRSTNIYITIIFLWFLLKWSQQLQTQSGRKVQRSCHHSKIHPNGHLCASSLKFPLSFLKNDGTFLSCLHPSNLIFRTFISCCCTWLSPLWFVICNCCCYTQKLHKWMNEKEWMNEYMCMYMHTQCVCFLNYHFLCLLDYKPHNWRDHVCFIITKASPLTIEDCIDHLWNQCMSKKFPRLKPWKCSERIKCSWSIKN